jgi:hypothetical protein
MRRYLYAAGLAFISSPSIAQQSQVMWYANRTGAPYYYGVLDGANVARNVFSMDGTGGGNLTWLGNLSISLATPSLLLNKPTSGSASRVVGSTNNLFRWVLAVGDATAESGSNAGSNFSLTRYNDAGTLIDNPMVIKRSTGQTRMGDFTDWTNALVPGLVDYSQLFVGSPKGYNGITGVSRSSDWRANNPTLPDPGLSGIVAFGINNDVSTTGGSSVGIGADILGAALASSHGITLATQMDISSQAVSADVSSSIPFVDHTTIGNLITSGAFAAIATHDISAAQVTSGGGLGPKFKKGYVHQAGAYTFSGGGGAGIAQEYENGMSEQWVDALGAVTTSFWGLAGTGLVVNSALYASGQISTATDVAARHFLDTGTVPAISACGTSPSIDARSTDSSGKFTTGTASPTSCTISFVVPFPNASFCNFSPANTAAAAAIVGTAIGTSVNGFVLALPATTPASYEYVCMGK